MKKCKLLLGLFAVAALGACNEGERSTTTTTTTTTTSKTLTAYVDSVDNATPVYTSASWQEIENGYTAREQELNARMSELSAEEKEEAEKARAKFASLKREYETKMRETDTSTSVTSDAKLRLRNNLFGDSYVGTDNTMQWVTAANIVSVYDRFVTTIDRENDKYTKEDWADITAYYRALDVRKEAVEKQLSSEDNATIAKHKARYGVLKAVNQPRAEGSTRDKIEDDVNKAAKDVKGAVKEAAKDTKEAVKEVVD